jgi:hypothetical protein
MLVVWQMAPASGTRAAVPIVVTPQNPNQTPVQPAAPHIVPHVTPQRNDRQVPDVPDREAPERTIPQRNSIGRNSPSQNTQQQKQNLSNPHVHNSASAHQDVRQNHADHIAARLREDRALMRDRAWHAWHHHWDYWIWYDWNLGRGSIEGNVRDASTGQPVAGAKVWLRDAVGRVLHYRIDQHVVRTDEAGDFFMHHVHRGVYTVRAISSGRQANADYLIAVHPGGVSLAMIHM